MKIVLINTPNREEPAEYPPLACLALKRYLNKNGEKDVDFINVDYHRPSIDELVEEIIKRQPDILAISAVVSTSYEFTKKVSLLVKERRPNTTIILGGNMGASAEILLRKTGVEYCFLGEGEIPLLEFVRRFRSNGSGNKFEDMEGIVYLSDQGDIVNTGYGMTLPKDQLYDVLWEDLGDSLEYYISDLFQDGKPTKAYFYNDKRTYEPHRRDKKYAVLPVGKGCAARCTFCHRWISGITHIPVDIIMRRLDHLIERHNVGFVGLSIEAFGIDKRWLHELCREIKKRDILWFVGAVRAKSVTKEIIAEMKAAGCASILYGLESGSQKILDIMEKKTDLAENINAQKWTVDAGFFDTVVQLVLGMPGETPETIEETIEFCKYSLTLNKNLNPNNFSINFAQALPGTPLYEYGRRIGLIGKTIDEEEKYLIAVSDANAADPTRTLNFTGYPMMVMWAWRYQIRLATSTAYIEKFGINNYLEVISDQQKFTFWDTNYDMGNIGTARPSIFSLIFRRKAKDVLFLYPDVLYKFRALLPLYMLALNYRRIGFSNAISYFSDYIAYLLFGVRGNRLNDGDRRSLRKIVNTDFEPIATDTPATISLRTGK